MSRARPLRWLRARLVGFPVSVKILGIGALVAVIFGTVTILEMRWVLTRVIREGLEQRAIALSLTLAESLERSLSTADVVSAHETITRAREINSDVRYVVIRDEAGHVLTHTFTRGVPTALMALAATPRLEANRLRVFRAEDGLVIDAVAPILRGKAGTVELGLSDAGVVRELRAAQNTILGGIGFCALLGVILALALTRLLTRPIDLLAQAVARISAGELEARAQVVSGDELGTLALAFNAMADNLSVHVRAVHEKEHARLVLLDRVVQSQEDERRAISRELHDHIGGSLSALLLAIRAVGAAPTAAGVEPLAGRVQTIIADVQRLVGGMRPPLLEEHGLEDALRRHVDRLSEETGLQVEVQFEGPGAHQRLPLRVETTLFRIAQESLTNILRHAGARSASIVVLRRPNEVVMLVEDDGRGFDAEAVMARHENSLGLSGMQERARLLAGECEIESTPDGTTVRVSLPLARNDDHVAEGVADAVGGEAS